MSRRLLLRIAGVVAVLLVLGGAYVWFSTPPGVGVVSISSPPSSVTAPPASLAPTSSSTLLPSLSTLAQQPTSSTTTTSSTLPPSSTLDPAEMTVVLFVGTDSRSGLDRSLYGNFSGARADSLILAVTGPGLRPSLVSLPRDLVVTDQCSGRQNRVNAFYATCGDWTAEARLSQVVSIVTGLEVDHLVVVDMAGLIGLVDRLGGYPVDLPAPLRDPDARLDLPAGAQVLSGEDALALVRSRKARQLVDGVWVSVPGGDLARAARQREFLLFVLSLVTSDPSPSRVLGIYQDLAPFLKVSSDLTTGVIVSMAASLPPASEFQTLAVPAEPGWLGEASVMYATVDVPSWFAEVLQRDFS